MAKYLDVKNLLEKRVLHGDYLLQEFPTDRELAGELQVDTRTARKAVQELIDAGLLARQSNGRVAVCRAKEAAERVLRIALLTVSYPTPYAERWHGAIEAVAAKQGMIVRVVGFTHLDDPVIRETLRAFDGIFFSAPATDVPPTLLASIRDSRSPVVFLDLDVSAHGLPCLWLASPIYIRRLLDHLHALGHKQIACLNTQPHGEVIVQRLDQCKLWFAATNVVGRLIDEPVQPSDDAMRRAYDVMKRLLADGRFNATALCCMTSAAAKGAMRALHEAGLRVGTDISVCAAEDGAGEAQFLVPSLTSMRDADPQPYLSLCMDWMARGGRDWVGPLLVQPHEVPLFVGESTGPARRG